MIVGIVRTDYGGPQKIARLTLTSAASISGTVSCEMVFSGGVSAPGAHEVQVLHDLDGTLNVSGVNVVDNANGTCSVLWSMHWTRDGHSTIRVICELLHATDGDIVAVGLLDVEIN